MENPTEDGYTTLPPLRGTEGVWDPYGNIPERENTKSLEPIKKRSKK